MPSMAYADRGKKKAWFFLSSNFNDVRHFIGGTSVCRGTSAHLRRGSLKHRRPQLELKDCQLVGHALRQFFLSYLKSGFRYVSMPSQVTDDLWHELILHTKTYDAFCKRAFGRFFHHSPAVALSSQQQLSNSGLRRVWWYACVEENINPEKPTRLPLLFAIDAKLKIADGFFYSADCSGLKRQQEADGGGPVVHCGGDFSSSTVDGSTEGFGGDSSTGDGAADGGGGCGGGGCGGD